MSGYDIIKQVQTASGTADRTGYETLYRMLYKLLAEDALKVQEFPQKARPSKKLDDITARGRTELDEWLKKPPRPTEYDASFW